MSSIPNISNRRAEYTQVLFILTPEEKEIVEKAMHALNYEDITNDLKTPGGFAKRLLMTYCKKVINKYESALSGEKIKRRA